MVGNDIVDLKQAAKDSNWRRNGYLNKICTPLERELILTDDDPSAMLWLIWSMKEASYKVINRMTGIRSFCPGLYACSDLAFNGSQATASINFDSCSIFNRAELQEDRVHSSAVLKKEELEYLQTYHLTNSRDYMDEFNKAFPEYLLTKNTAGLPFITHLSTLRTYYASVSHHGRYAAIVYSDFLQSAD